MCIYMYTQLWARAYRDQTYHAAINTTNGVESQNKLLKYSYLPRRKNITLSQLAEVLYEDFVPETHHKYLYLNYQMSDNYRRYNDFVPGFLRGRPRQVIIHCLERKSSSKKYTDDDILTKDVTSGKFTIQGLAKYTALILVLLLVTLRVHALTGYNGTFPASTFLVCFI